MAKETKRNRHGSGTIYRTSDGRYRGQVSLGVDQNGKRIRRSVSGNTRREVQEAITRLQNDALRGIAIADDRITVKQHFEDWLRTKRPPNTRSSTYDKYAAHVNHDIIPALGRHRLRELSYRHINAFYEMLDERHLSPRTVFDIRSILSMGLEDAVRKELITRNPVKVAAKRSKCETEARCLTPDEIRWFLQAAKGERLEDAFILALNTGMRPGEWMGLPWDAIDWHGSKLTIRQAVHEERGKVFLGPLKTENGRRTISLPREALDALTRQRTRQDEEKLALGDAWNNKNNLVFTDSKGNMLRRTNIVRRDLKRICRRAGILRIAERLSINPEELELVNPGTELTVNQVLNLPSGGTYKVQQTDILDNVILYTFRHTHASLLIYQGVDIKTVSKRLGHKSINITLHVFGKIGIINMAM
ncbi:MAG TPA: site-specific integrase [Firmicutes bacterium]|nr:site-specific integrase [Bacillota bacterium]